MGLSGRILGIGAACALLSLATACGRADAPAAPSVATSAQRIARTVDIIRTATPADPKTLKILFYGQSITSTAWTDPAMAYLRRKYPNVRFIYRNMALGGFGSVLLERTVTRDITEFYPDLIVFHVYGDHHAYERIIREMRSRTAADIIVQNDQMTAVPEPLCEEGPRLSIEVPAGCKGAIWLKQNSWEEFMSSRFVPEMAERYELALEPRRAAWEGYLRRRGLGMQALLADGTHPNAAGWRLMAAVFTHYFDRFMATPNIRPGTNVTDVPLPPDNVGEITLEGNRIELIAAGPLNGQVTATVDGKAPRDIDGCWQTSRTSVHPNVTDWPAIRQVTVTPSLHREERWVATVSDLNADQSDFTFQLSGSKTGPDGTGRGSEDFESKSGNVTIAAQDWVLREAAALSKRQMADGSRIEWSRSFICDDEPAVALTQHRFEVRHVVATGLANGPHSVTLRIAPAVRPLVKSIRVYRPTLETDE